MERLSESAFWLALTPPAVVHKNHEKSPVATVFVEFVMFCFCWEIHLCFINAISSIGKLQCINLRGCFHMFYLAAWLFLQPVSSHLLFIFFMQSSRSLQYQQQMFRGGYEHGSPTAPQSDPARPPRGHTTGQWMPPEPVSMSYSCTQV